MLSPGSRLRPRRAALAAATAATLCALAPASSHAAAGFAGGNIAYQSGQQCGFDGSVGYGHNTGSWVSWYTDPNAGYPAVGDKYWLRIDAMAIGYTCAGFVSDITTELALPADTRLAIDLQSQDPNDRVRCFYEGPSGTREVTDMTWRVPDIQASGSWCSSRQAPSQSAHGYHFGQRMIGPGESFFLIVPVMSTKRLAGMGGAGNTTRATATLQSGINTTAQPFQWVTVFDRLPAIGYDTNPISAVGDTTATTTGVLGAWYRKGTLYHDLGLASGQFTTTTNPIAIDGQFAGYTSKQTWASLTPGTTYQWRMRFVDATTGAVTVGETKTFKTTGTAPVTPPPPPPPPANGGGITPQEPPAGGGGTPPPVDGGGKPGGGEKPPVGGGGGQPPSGGGGGGTGAPSAPGGAEARTNAAPTGPSPTHAPSTLPPAARLVAGAKLAALLKPAGLGVDVSCATACQAKVSLKVDAATARKLGLGRKPVVIASGTGSSAKGGSFRVALKASAAAKRKLRRAKKVKAALVVQTAGGQPVTTTVTVAR